MNFQRRSVIGQWPQKQSIIITAEIVKYSFRTLTQVNVAWLDHSTSYFTEDVIRSHVASIVGCQLEAGLWYFGWIRFVGQECVLERSASTAPQPPFIKANAKQEAKSENIGSLVNRYNELLADGLAQLKHATPFTDNTNIGAELAKYRNEAFTANSRPESLGKILQHHKTKSNWLVSMYARLATLRERTIDPSYCKEDYFENEQLLKRKEKAWKVLNNVVNKLAPSWGVLANLVYSSVEVKCIKLSEVSDLKPEILEDLASGIATNLLAQTTKIDIPHTFPILIPAVFFSCVTGDSFTKSCELFRLSNLAGHPLQEIVDEYTEQLSTHGLYCGHVPLNRILHFSEEFSLLPRCINIVTPTELGTKGLLASANNIKDECQAATKSDHNATPHKDDTHQRELYHQSHYWPESDAEKSFASSSKRRRLSYRESSIPHPLPQRSKYSDSHLPSPPSSFQGPCYRIVKTIPKIISDVDWRLSTPASVENVRDSRVCVSPNSTYPATKKHQPLLALDSTDRTARKNERNSPRSSPSSPSRTSIWGCEVEPNTSIRSSPSSRYYGMHDDETPAILPATPSALDSTHASPTAEQLINIDEVPRERIATPNDYPGLLKGEYDDSEEISLHRIPQHESQIASVDNINTQQLLVRPCQLINTRVVTSIALQDDQSQTGIPRSAAEQKAEHHENIGGKDLWAIPSFQPHREVNYDALQRFHDGLGLELSQGYWASNQAFHDDAMEERFSADKNGSSTPKTLPNSSSPLYPALLDNPFPLRTKLELRDPSNDITDHEYANHQGPLAMLADATQHDPMLAAQFPGLPSPQPSEIRVDALKQLPENVNSLRELASFDPEEFPLFSS